MSIVPEAAAIELAQSYDEAAAVCRKNARDARRNGWPDRVAGIQWRQAAIKNRRIAFKWREYARGVPLR